MYVVINFGSLIVGTLLMVRVLVEQLVELTCRGFIAIKELYAVYLLPILVLPRGGLGVLQGVKCRRLSTLS